MYFLSLFWSLKQWSLLKKSHGRYQKRNQLRPDLMMMILRMLPGKERFVSVIIITFFSFTKTLYYQCNRVHLTCSLKSISSCMFIALQCTIMSSPFGWWIITGQIIWGIPLLCALEYQAILAVIRTSHLCGIWAEFQRVIKPVYFVYCQLQIKFYSYIYGINLNLVFYSSKMESRGMNSHINKMLASWVISYSISSDSTHDLVKTALSK